MGSRGAHEAALGVTVHMQRLRLARRGEGFVALEVSRGPAEFEVVLLGSSGREYTVRYDAAGGMRCDCMDGKSTRDVTLPTGRGLRCKHLCWLLVEKGGCSVRDVTFGTADEARSLETIREALRKDVHACTAPFLALQAECGGEECCVCYEGLGVPDGCSRCPDCGNHFHAACIARCLTFRRRCPLCRGGAWARWRAPPAAAAAAAETMPSLRTDEFRSPFGESISAPGTP